MLFPTFASSISKTSSTSSPPVLPKSISPSKRMRLLQLLALLNPRQQSPPSLPTLCVLLLVLPLPPTTMTPPLLNQVQLLHLRPSLRRQHSTLHLILTRARKISPFSPTFFFLLPKDKHFLHLPSLLPSPFFFNQSNSFYPGHLISSTSVRRTIHQRVPFLPPPFSLFTVNACRRNHPKVHPFSTNQVFFSSSHVHLRPEEGSIPTSIPSAPLK